MHNKRKRKVGFSRGSLKVILKDLSEVEVMCAVPRIALVTEASLELDGDPVSFINGEPIQSSVNELSDVFLPVSSLIDIYHQGYPVYVNSESSIVYLVEKISDILDRLDVHKSEDDKDIFEYIEGFYLDVLKQKKKTITEVLSSEPRVKSIGLAGNDSLLLDHTSRHSVIDLSDVVVI